MTGRSRRTASRCSSSAARRACEYGGGVIGVGRAFHRSCRDHGTDVRGARHASSCCHVAVPREKRWEYMHEYVSALFGGDGAAIGLVLIGGEARLVCSAVSEGPTSFEGWWVDRYISSAYPRAR